MHVYTVKNNKVIRTRQEANNYVLQEGEFGFPLEVIVYEIVDNVLTDLTTQADRDARANAEAKTEKQKLIAQGVTIEHNGIELHFEDITELNNFITQKNELEKIGHDEMGWVDANEVWQTISLVDAQNIFLQAMQGFQTLYQS